MADTRDDELLSTADAARLLSLSADMVRLLARDGRLPIAVKSVRGVRMFRRSDVEALAAERAGRAGYVHSVQFYESDEFLCDVVAEFLYEGLRADAATAAIVTRPHSEGIATRLQVRGVDVGAAKGSGQLTIIDAEELLEELTARGRLEARAFRTAATQLYADMTKVRGRGRPRIFGEMVDLLCRRGQPSAAVELESMWNEFAVGRSFSLFCGYSVASFPRASHAQSFRKICDTHVNVAPSEHFDRNDMRKAAELEQRARALEGEVERRKRAERTLRKKRIRGKS